ncbi:MAG TPA: C13 family peptidase [Candidatus Deferrimicrobium sp.]|nr:C13 family peptidase [Candidatus Deferrimicrobium sp.]
MNKKLVLFVIAICAVLTISLIIIVTPKQHDRIPVINDPTPGDVFAIENTEVTVVVTDDKGISAVILSYSNDSKVSWYNVTMVGSGTTFWTGLGIIPPNDIEVTIYYKIYAKDTADQWAVNDNNTNCFNIYTGARKAFIVASANDFYGSEFEDDFNNGMDANFTADTGKWQHRVSMNINVDVNPSAGGCLTMPGALLATTAGPGYAELVYNWSDYYAIAEYAYYNISAWIWTESPFQVGPGVKIGLEWWNSSGQVVRTDWSISIPDTAGSWIYLSVDGPCNNETGNEITELKLVIALNGTWNPADEVGIDDIRIERWITVNLTDPFDPGTPPPPRNKNCDGFPAQALQVYKILKSHGYSDENIYFMLYYKDDADGKIDITQTDGPTNDLIGAIIDAENDSVTANNVKQELNVSVAGSFASKIQPNDQLIIFMTDHGSNAVLTDKNATFHFEADGSSITEFEFFDLVSKIKCWRIMINMDCCFSGNFLNQNSSIGLSWYNLTNCLFVSASANALAWYWVDNGNGDLFAGSWFFHVFWDQLDQGSTVGNAFTFAQLFVPAGKVSNLALIQAPLMQDNLGINNTWSFTSFSKL